MGWKFYALALFSSKSGFRRLVRNKRTPPIHKHITIKYTPMFDCKISYWETRAFILIVCSMAFGIAAFVALSIPLNTLPIDSYVAEIQFNEEMFSGSVNQFPVLNLTSLRLGNWAGSYADLNYTHMKMPVQSVSGYTIDIAKDHPTHTIHWQIVQKVSTIWLGCNVFFGVAILFTCCQVYLPKICLTYWMVEVAIIITSAAAIIVNLVFFFNIKSRMQKLSETIVTKEGTVFVAIIAADFVALVAICLNRYLAKQLAKPAKAKAGGGGPKTTTTAVQFNTTPAIDPGLNVSPAAYQRVLEAQQTPQQQRPRQQGMTSWPHMYPLPPPPGRRRRTSIPWPPSQIPQPSSQRPGFRNVPPPKQKSGGHVRDERLKEIADETLEAIEVGAIRYPESVFYLQRLIKATEKGTEYIRPDALNNSVANWRKAPRLPNPPAMTLYGATTLQIARDLAINNIKTNLKVGVLNFANATKAGGGFRNGAKAQEESIARSSTLIRSLESPQASPFYRLHKGMEGKNNEHYYSHAMIYSPSVTIFRDDDGGWISPYNVDIVTSPAVNAMKIRGRTYTGNNVENHILRVMGDRMARILALFEQHGIRHLVLGSFGTGVFKNDIKSVAGLWRQLLEHRFANSFDVVDFAIQDDKTKNEFQKGWGG